MIIKGLSFGSGARQMKLANSQHAAALHVVSFVVIIPVHLQPLLAIY